MAQKNSRKKQRAPKATDYRDSVNSVPLAPKARWEELARQEQLAVVCRLFCAGHGPAEIARRIREDYATQAFTRQSAYPILLKAAQAGRLRFVPKASFTLAAQLRHRYNWLAGAEVVHTNQFEDVAYQGAETLITLLQHVSREPERKVHIGFAGGHAMRRLAQIFAQLLAESGTELPKTLVLHALVAGFEVRDPTTDPNTFFTLFQNRMSVNTKFEFVGLHTPPVVHAGEYNSLRHVEGIRESYEYAKDLDIIVTSAADWSHQHSTFRKYMERSPGCSDILVKADCRGDMLWLPLGPTGPLQIKTEVRAMTLIELPELPRFIKRGKYVLLVLGPCAICQETKSRILSAILNSKQQLISHLVVDTRSAKEAMQSSP